MADVLWFLSLGRQSQGREHTWRHAFMCCNSVKRHFAGSRGVSRCKGDADSGV